MFILLRIFMGKLKALSYTLYSARFPRVLLRGRVKSWPYEEYRGSYQQSPARVRRLFMKQGKWC